MPNVRARIAMTPREASAFVAAGRTLAFVTIGPDGVPDPTAMWYVADPDGTLRMHTYARSQKAENLRRDPRASALVEAGERYDELRGVQLTGRVELVDDLDWRTDTALALLTKYQGVDPARYDELRDSARALVAKRVGLRLVVERVVSWDHRKLAGLS